MAWTDEARAAAAEARKANAKKLAEARLSLKTDIEAGINKKLKPGLVPQLRKIAADTIRHNRKALGGVIKGSKLHEMLHMTAALKIKLLKNDMMNGMAKLHPMYSKGLSASKIKGSLGRSVAKPYKGK